MFYKFEFEEYISFPLSNYFINTNSDFFLFIVDNFIFYNPNHLLVGFSGIIFGTFSFILLSSLYGKEYILNIFIGLKKNNEIYKLMTVFLSLGIVYSFLPSISLSGHIAGILSGFIIFIL